LTVGAVNVGGLVEDETDRVMDGLVEGRTVSVRRGHA